MDDPMDPVRVKLKKAREDRKALDGLIRKYEEAITAYEAATAAEADLLPKKGHGGLRKRPITGKRIVLKNPQQGDDLHHAFAGWNKVTVRQAALAALVFLGKPMRAPDILEALLSRGCLNKSLVGGRPVNHVITALWSQMKRDRAAGRDGVVKESDGIYRFASEEARDRFKKEIEEALKEK